MAKNWGFIPKDNAGLVFISYNSLDEERVAPIAKKLSRKGVPVWYDNGLKAGTDAWETQINKHIRLSSVVVLFVTKGIFKREKSYVITEYKQAKSLGKTILPVFLDADVTSAEFCKKWAKESPNSYDKYSTCLSEWTDAEGVTFAADADDDTWATAIKLKLDQSEEIRKAMAHQMGSGKTGQFKYRVYDRCIEIAKYIDTESEVIIPDTIDGKTVTSIGDGAFLSCEYVTSVSIPKTVDSIGFGAFRDCEALTDLILPEKLAKIEEKAFYGCSELTTVNLPNIISIGGMAFENCTNLETVNLGDKLERIGIFAFAGCESLAEVVIPDSVTKINDFAFDGCEVLESVTLGKNTEIIGINAFSDCDCLSEINLPETLKVIDDYAFENCVDLKKINIPDSVETLGNGVFWCCDCLEDVKLGKGITYLPYMLFGYCKSLKNIKIPKSVKTINADAFEGGSVEVAAPHKMTYYGEDEYDGVIKWKIKL